MITTALFGGLGNQMFIYAMARAMSLRNHSGMAFNLTNGFATDYLFHRSLELNHFALQLPKSALTTFDYGLGRAVRNISRKIGRNILSPNYRIIKESLDMHYQSEIATCFKSDLYLEGYWQSPQYFADCKDIIRSDFKLRTPVPNDVEEELKLLQQFNCPLVMVGVRRYQECQGTSYLTEHLCDEHYYVKTMEYMTKHLNNPLFVIFSQDREWVKQKLPQGYNLHFATPKEGEFSAISDLYLMNHCHHAIISNSSFYWWGAWLQKSSAKQIVIAPDNFINRDCVDSDWLTFSI